MALFPLFTMAFAAIAAVTSMGRRIPRLAVVPRWAIALAGITPLIVLMTLR
jgi:hypothetical protein